MPINIPMKPGFMYWGVTLDSLDLEVPFPSSGTFETSRKAQTQESANGAIVAQVIGRSRDKQTLTGILWIVKLGGTLITGWKKMACSFIVNTLISIEEYGKQKNIMLNHQVVNHINLVQIRNQNTMACLDF